MNLTEDWKGFMIYRKLFSNNKRDQEKFDNATRLQKNRVFKTHSVLTTFNIEK